MTQLTYRRAASRRVLATISGVRFTLATKSRPGDVVMTPDEATAHMLDLLRKKRTCKP